MPPSRLFCRQTPSTSNAKIFHFLSTDRRRRLCPSPLPDWHSGPKGVIFTPSQRDTEGERESWRPSHRDGGTGTSPNLPRPPGPAAPAAPLRSPPALTVPLSSTPSRCRWRISMGAAGLECTKVPLKTWASGGRCGEPMAAASGLAAVGGARFVVTEAAGSCHPAGCRPSVSPGAAGGFLELSPFPHPLVTFSSGSGFSGGRAAGRAAPFPRRRRAGDRRCPLAAGTRPRGARGAPLPQKHQPPPPPDAASCRNGFAAV